jgi:hypothetical protein
MHQNETIAPPPGEYDTQKEKDAANSLTGLQVGNAVPKRFAMPATVPEFAPAENYFFGGLIIICAPAVPGNISHGACSLAFVDSPVDSGVAKGR